MSTFQAFRPLQRYADFSGRSGRAEFWQWFALLTILNWLVGMMDDLGSTFEHGPPVLWLIWQAASIVPHSAVTCRRLHDRGKSGWLYFGNAALMILAVTLMAAGRALIDEGSSAGQSTFDIAMLIGVLSLAWLVYLIVELAKPGDDGPNKYGPPPSDEAARQPSSVASAAVTFASKLGQGDPLAQIERLSSLHQQGALTDEEFAQQKAALLKRL